MSARDDTPLKSWKGYVPPGLLSVAAGTVRTPGAAATYTTHFEGAEAKRLDRYAVVTNDFYDLITDFYEYGWGDSFHLAPRYHGESLRAAILRHEHWLALQLGLDQGMRVLDLGCGVGGPMRNIARFAGCHVTGVNLNDYQIRRAEDLNRRAGLSDRCTLLKADFTSLPLPPRSLDAAYAIEATVHAPHLREVYASVRRVLKPGALFATYEWCLLPAYDPTNAEHQRLRRSMEIGNGLVALPTRAQVEEAIAGAGFEVLRIEDRGTGLDIPWWEPFVPEYNPLRMRKSSGLGLAMTNAGVSVLQGLRIAPRGTLQVARLLGECSRALFECGRSGLFTPGLFILARAPFDDQR